MMRSQVFLVLLSFINITPISFSKDIPAYPLPPFIKKTCSWNDPNINQCVVDVGGPIIKQMVKGNDKYKVPKLDPMRIAELRIKQGTKQVGLEFVCNDCDIWGLANTKFIKANEDLEGGHFRWDFTLDELKLLGKYNASGKVLLLPITGYGDCEILLEKFTFSYIFDCEYEKKSNGFTYFKITNHTCPIDIGHMKIKLDNLFNGDKLLGDNMNRFLNENWKDLVKDLSPALSETMSQIMSTTINNVASLVPVETLFPKK